MFSKLFQKTKSFHDLESSSLLVEEGVSREKWGTEDPGIVLLFRDSFVSTQVGKLYDLLFFWFIDYNIPAEIARLSDNSMYQTFSEAVQDDSASSSFLTPRDTYNRLTQREIDENTKLESIQESISSLKPYLIKKIKEGSQLIQVQEMYPSGESGYKNTISLNRLLSMIHDDVVKIDEESSVSRSDVEKDLLSKRKLSGIREMRLHDLRNLEEQFSMHDEPTILVRRHAVLMSFNPIRTIIMANKMILIVPDGADSLLYLLHEHMHGMVENYPKDKRNNSDDNISYEYTAYQAIFSTILALHNLEYLNMESRVRKVISNFKSNSNSNITVSIQENIRGLKSILSVRMNKVSSYQRLLQDILQKEDDMGYMCLSYLKTNPDLYSENSLDNSLRLNCVEVENLLESYLMDYNTLYRKLQFLNEQLENIEDLIRFKLDTSRNELLIIDASMNILMAAVSIGTFITALFGMNIGNGFETFGYPYLFWSVSISLCIVIIVVIRLIINRYNVMSLLPSKKFENLTQI